MTFSKGITLFSVVVCFVAVVISIVALIEHVEMSKYYWICVGYSASSFVWGLIDLIQDEV